MIPLFKNSLARMDLHSVLDKMVQYAIDGFDAGQVLSRQLASRLCCTAGIMLRTPHDIFHCILEMLQTSKEDFIPVPSQKAKALLILPITCPKYIVYSLRSLHCNLYFYDVAEDGISPLVHIKELEKQIILHKEKNAAIVWVAVYHFSTSNEQCIKVPSLLQDIASLAIAFSIPPQREKDSEELQTEQKDQCFSNYDFVSIVLEQNTFITSATGMMLCIREKKHARLLKFLERYYLQLSDLNAALAHSQFKQLDMFINKVLHIKKLYCEALSRSKYAALDCITDEDAVALSFPIQCKANVIPILRFISKQKVESGLAFRDSYLSTFLQDKTMLKDSISQYPHASKLAQSTIQLPLYASLQNDEVHNICKVLASLP